MTRKHFKMIADRINADMKRHAENNNTAASLAVFELAHDLAADFRHVNPRFDQSRFLEACGCT